MQNVKLDNTVVGLLLVVMGVMLHALGEPSKEKHDISLFLVSGGIGLLGTDKNRDREN